MREEVSLIRPLAGRPQAAAGSRGFGESPASPFHATVGTPGREADVMEHSALTGLPVGPAAGYVFRARTTRFV